MPKPSFADVLKQMKRAPHPYPHILLDGDVTLLLDGERHCWLDVYMDTWQRILAMNLPHPFPHILIDGDITLPLDGERHCWLDVYMDTWQRVIATIKNVDTGNMHGFEWGFEDGFERVWR